MGTAPGVTVHGAVIQKKKWIEWRLSLGVKLASARKQWRLFTEWAAQENANPPARVLQVAPWQDWEREFRAFLDAMPRRPFKFLQMVQANENRREALMAVVARKAKNRERYERAYARRGKK